MSGDIEAAQQGLEHAHEAAERHEATAEWRGARRIAVLISVLAAALALAEMGEKGAQNEYLTHHVALSDDWAFYQAKTIRADLWSLHADELAALPDADEPAIQKRIAAARATVARLQDDDKTLGRKQLAERAKHETEERNAAFERYHQFELVTGGLQIAIVLASVSIVVRQHALAVAAATLGAAGMAYGLLVATGVV